MKNIINMIIILSLSYGQAFATLTPKQIPVTKTGGSTPVLQDGSITDTGSPSLPNNVGIGSTSPANILEIREPNLFSKVYDFNGVSTYSDDTTQAKITYGTPFQILATNSHIVYVGSTIPFSGLSVALSTVTTATDALIITYWNGSWSSLTNTDNTNNFQNDGTINFTAPGDWATTAVNGQTLYWVAITSTSTFTHTASIYSIRPGTDSVLATFCSVSDTVPCLYVGQNGNLLSPNISGTQTSVATPTTIVVGLPTSRQGRRVDFMCSGIADQVCLNKALTACGTGKCEIKLLEGTWNITDSWGYRTSSTSLTPLVNNLTISGLGAGLTKIVSSNGIYASIQDIVNFNSGSPLTNLTIRDIEIDRSADTKDANVQRKCVFIKYMNNVHIYRTYMHGAGGTCLGIDFLNGSHIEDNKFDTCGTSTATTGSSGIGIGTGNGTEEPNIITNNTITNSGFADILLEDQLSTLPSADFIVTNNHMLDGPQYGLVLRGVKNVVFSDNIDRGHTKDNIFIDDYHSQLTSNIIIRGNDLTSGSAYALNNQDAGATNYIVEGNNMTGNSSGTILNTMSDLTQMTRWLNLGDTTNYLAGNVGIGSTSPRGAIDVGSGSYYGDGSHLSGLSGSGTVNSGTANQAAYYAGSGTAVSGTSNLIFSGSNVGVGSATPGQALDITGTVRTTNFISTANVSIGTNAMTALQTIQQAADTNSGGSAVLNTAQTGSTRVWEDASNRTRIDGGSAATGIISLNGGQGTGTGNVGIGTITAGAALTVWSNVATSGSTVFQLTQQSGHVWNTQSLGSASATNPNSYLIRDNTAGVNRLLIDGNGNIGLGTTLPSQRLDVSGTVKFTNQLLNTTSATGIGWTVKTGANTACNTTCGTSSCVFGEDLGTAGVLNSSVVACTDATADNCLCAGP